MSNMGGARGRGRPRGPKSPKERAKDAAKKCRDNRKLQVGSVVSLLVDFINDPSLTTPRGRELLLRKARMMSRGVGDKNALRPIRIALEATGDDYTDASGAMDDDHTDASGR